MRVCFWHSDKPREQILADGFGLGVLSAGDSFEKRALEPTIPTDLSGIDVACMVGVKSRELYRAHWRAGIHVVYLDKGYTRHTKPGPIKVWEYWRVALDAHHPTDDLFRTTHNDTRADELGLVFQPWRERGAHILLAGSSEKYHEFYGMKHPTAWAQRTVDELRKHTTREIIYRPKPSWREATPIKGARFNREGSIDDALEGAWALVTHGSNAVFESVLAGVPTITLGPAVSSPISSHELTEIESPRLATMNERHQWLWNLAWWQWTMQEMAAGDAWKFLRPQIFGHQRIPQAEAGE